MSLQLLYTRDETSFTSWTARVRREDFGRAVRLASG